MNVLLQPNFYFMHFLFCMHATCDWVLLTEHNASRPYFIVSLWMPILLGIVTPGNLRQNFL